MTTNSLSPEWRHKLDTSRAGDYLLCLLRPLASASMTLVAGMLAKTPSSAL